MLQCTCASILHLAKLFLFSRNIFLKGSYDGRQMLKEWEHEPKVEVVRLSIDVKGLQQGVAISEGKGVQQCLPLFLPTHPHTQFIFVGQKNVYVSKYNLFQDKLGDNLEITWRYSLPTVKDSVTQMQCCFLSFPLIRSCWCSNRCLKYHFLSIFHFILYFHIISAKNEDFMTDQLYCIKPFITLDA